MSSVNALNFNTLSHTVQSVAYRTLEQEVANSGSIHFDNGYPILTQ